MTFRRRMLGAVMALTLLTLGGAFTAIAFSVNRAQERQLDQALLAEAREEAAEIASVGGRRLTISDRPGPAANDVGPLTKYGAIYGDDGAVIAATPTWRRSPPRAAALPGETAMPFDLYADREHLRGVLVPVPSPARGRLLLAAPRADLDGDASFLHRAMVMVLLVACAWTLALASWFTRRLTRDQQRIMEVAHRAAGGDLTARVAQKSADADLSQLGRDLDDTLTRLEASVEAQRRFIAYAAHELRAPLTALLGEITFTLRRERDAKTYRDALVEAQDATERLCALSEDLLALARLGASSSLDRAEINLDAVLTGAVDDLRGERGEAPSTIRIAATSLRVFGHPSDLRRLLRNLLENALRHTPAGEEVRVDTWSAEGRVCIAVDDAGVGLPAKDRERVFEPFFRIERTAPAPDKGAGLGLTIAREISQAHGGSLRVETGARGRGARFILELPGSDADQGDAR